MKIRQSGLPDSAHLCNHADNIDHSPALRDQMPSQGTIGDRVRGLRLSRRMSQAQLAGPDLSDSYVSLIESGKRTPTPVVARILAERLGCTTEFLLHGIEPRQRIDTELGLRHAELELNHGDPGAAADRFGEIIKAAGEEKSSKPQGR